MATTIKTNNNPRVDGDTLDNYELYTGGALHFDGIGDILSVSDSHSNGNRALNPAHGDTGHTWSFWVKSETPTNPSSEVVIVNKYWDADRIRFLFQTDGDILFKFSNQVDPGAYTAQINTNQDFHDGRWHFVVGTITPNSLNGLKLYVDGALIVSSGTATGNIFEEYSNQRDLIFGRHPTNYGTEFAGYISNFQMWNISWSLEDVIFNYLNPEKLITENSNITTGITNDNLMLWLPMNDGDTLSNSQVKVQSLRHNSLGPEMITGGTFDENTVWADVAKESSGYHSGHTGGVGDTSGYEWYPAGFITNHPASVYPNKDELEFYKHADGWGLKSGLNGWPNTHQNSVNVYGTMGYKFANHQITPGNKYRLSLDIKSLKDHGTDSSGNPVDNVNSGTEPTVFIGINSGSNPAYVSAGLFAHNFQISTTMETYTFDFIATRNISNYYLWIGRSLGSTSNPYDPGVDIVVNNISCKPIFGEEFGISSFYGDTSDLLTSSQKAATGLEDVISSNNSSIDFQGSDGTLTDLDSTELVTNGNFPSGLSNGDDGYDNGDNTVDGWTAHNSAHLSILTTDHLTGDDSTFTDGIGSWSTSLSTNGTESTFDHTTNDDKGTLIHGSGNNHAVVTYNLSTKAGREYKVSFTYVQSYGQLYGKVGTAAGGQDVLSSATRNTNNSNWEANNEIITFSFTAASANSYICFTHYDAGAYGGAGRSNVTFDNFTIKSRDLKILNSTTAAARATYEVTTVVGDTYEASVTYDTQTGSATECALRAGSSVIGAEYGEVRNTSNDPTIKMHFTATTTTSYLMLDLYSDNTSGHYLLADNVSVKKVDKFAIGLMDATGANGGIPTEAAFAVESNEGELKAVNSKQPLVMMPFSTESGKTYRVSIRTDGSSSGSPGGLYVGASTHPITWISSTSTINTSGSSAVRAGGTGWISDKFNSVEITADGNTCYAFIFNEYGTTDAARDITHLSCQEVGITDGWTSSDNEDIIPQKAFMSASKKLYFDGSGDYVDMGDLDLVAPFTVSLWAQIENMSSGTYNTLFSHSANLRLYTVDKTLYDAGNDTSYSATATMSYDTNNKFRHITIVDDDTRRYLYIDGVLQYKTGNSAGGYAASADSSTQADGLLIGRWSDSQTGRDLKGLIDEISIFDTNFSQSDVRELYNNGLALNANNHSKSGYILGYWQNNVMNQYSLAKWADIANVENLTFDGSDDYLSLSGTYHDMRVEGAELTLTAWVKYDVLDATTDVVGEIMTASGWQHTFKFQHYYDGFYAGKFSLGYCRGSSSSPHQIVAYIDSADTNWHHVAVTIDENDVGKLYFDGALIKTQTGVTPQPDYAVFNGFQIGKDRSLTGSPNMFKGKMDQLSTWSTPLSEKDILAMYNHGKNKDIRDMGLTGKLGFYFNFETKNITDDGEMANLGSGPNLTMHGGIAIADANHHGTVSGTGNKIYNRAGISKNRDLLGFESKIKHLQGGVYISRDQGTYINVSSNEKSEVYKYRTRSLTDIFRGGGTVQCWIKPMSTTANMGIINKRGNGNQGWHLTLENFDTDALGLEFWAKFSTTSAQQIKKRIITPYIWTYITVVFKAENGEKAILYKNGEALTLDTGASDVDTAGSATYKTDQAVDLLIGAKDTSNCFEGSIDDVRIYDKILTPEEILKNYNKSKSTHSNE